MYKYLSILITTPDPSAFQMQLKAFTTLWGKQEPQFIEYFNGQFARRTGMYTYNMHAWHNNHYHQTCSHGNFIVSLTYQMVSCTIYLGKGAWYNYPQDLAFKKSMPKNVLKCHCCQLHAENINIR